MAIFSRRGAASVEAFAFATRQALLALSFRHAPPPSFARRACAHAICQRFIACFRYMSARFIPLLRLLISARASSSHLPTLRVAASSPPRLYERKRSAAMRQQRQEARRCRCAAARAADRRRCAMPPACVAGAAACRHATPSSRCLQFSTPRLRCPPPRRSRVASPCRSSRRR